MYRKHALRHTSSAICEELFAEALTRLKRQVVERSIRLGGRAALQCMAYLLRRRAFDDAFLPEDSTASREAKALLHYASKEIRAGRLGVMGGTVDVPAVMRTIVNYIDRRGTGRIVLVDD